MKWYWIDTKWACGGIALNSSYKVIITPPILRKLLGKSKEHLRMMGYKLKPLEPLNDSHGV